MMTMPNTLKECIDACLSCATECDRCATACLHEDSVKDLVRCIELNKGCAAFCRATAEMMSMGSEFAEHVCSLCARICEACAEECEKHSDLGHCQKCAENCRICAELCLDMTKALQH
jgi:hypothetical protein